MKKFTAMSLAAAVASLSMVFAGTAVAQGPGSDADRGAVVTDEVPVTEEKHPSRTHMASGVYVADLIGHTVQNRRSGKEVGEVSNLVIDEDGKVVAVLVNREAVNGAGKRDIAIGWEQMDRVVEDGDSALFIDMDEKALEALPEYAHR